jgi:hypothetical protein
MLFYLVFSGGAVIKYGSLAASLPFEPDAVKALAIVTLPPTLYGTWLLLKN